MLQAEQLTITQNVTSTNVSFLPVLSPTLKYTHFAGSPDGIRMEAEVGLLTRSVVVRTHAESANDTAKQGGHLIFLKQTGVPPTVRLSYAEFTKLGQQGVMARYPIHFHLNGDNPDSYVEGCSIHHCYQRAITIHGTNKVKVTNNVAYDIYGHTYFLEDSTEVENELVGNLGLVTQQFLQPWTGFNVTPQPIVGDSDKRPATFWVTNSNNKLENNVAAGSSWYGFEFAIPYAPLTVNSVTNVFKDNVAHSNGVNGFHSDSSRNFPSNGQQVPVSVKSQFINFTAYKNRNAGVWARQYGQAEWLDTKLSDNLIGFYGKRPTVSD